MSRWNLNRLATSRFTERERQFEPRCEPVVNRTRRSSADGERVIGAPDLNEREQILTIHTESIPLSSDVSLRELAERTDGYVGNDLENVT